MHNPQVTANLPYIFESTGYYSQLSSYSYLPYSPASPAVLSPYAVPNNSGCYYSNDIYARSQGASGLQRAGATHGNVGTEGLVGRARAAKIRSRVFGRERTGVQERNFYQML